MTVLITNWMLQGNSGTEGFARDLALGLLRRGHRPVVFTQRVGAAAELLRSAGVPVTTDPADLPGPPDVIHGQHTVPTMLASMAWPSVPALFVCHDRRAWHDAAPCRSAISAWVGVDDLCRERLARETGLPLEKIHWIGNAVDMERFRRRKPLPAAPRRALLFDNYAAPRNFLPLVREVCEMEGLAFDIAGVASGNLLERPEEIVGEYDLVFAKARCAMEALAAGCAVVLCGGEGVGPLVSREEFHAYHRLNFGGGCLRRPHSVELLRASIASYDAASCAAVTDLARSTLDADAAIVRWEQVYAELAPGPKAANRDLAKEGAATLAQLEPALFESFDAKNNLVHYKHLLAGSLAKSAALRARKDELARQVGVLKRNTRELRKRPESGVRLTGIMRRLWEVRWLRPLAKLLGVREHRKQLKEVPDANEGTRPQP